MNIKKHYQPLLDLYGVSGHEQAVRAYVRERLTPLCDELLTDHLGSIFGLKRGSAQRPLIMVASHLDEVGLMITKIEANGFLRFLKLGGIDDNVLISQNVELLTEQGPIPGVIGAIPPHIGGGSALTADKMQIDIGAKDAAEAQSWGVAVGTPVAFVNNFYVQKNPRRFVSKAWDNRGGVGVMLEIAEAIQTVPHPNTVALGATVQEEVGLRGARTSTALIKPDLFIAVDVSPVADFLPETGSQTGALGAGFLLRFYDPGNIMPPKLVQYVKKLAEAKGIKYQYFQSKGGTDAVAGQYESLAITIGIPGRYIHSTASIVDSDDLRAVRDIVVEIIKDCSAARLAELLPNA